MAATTAGAVPARRRSLPLPRIWPVRATDLYALAIGNAVLIGAMWVRHGGLDELGTVAGAFMAAGQLSALFGTYLALLEVVLMSRAPWLDQAFGMDRLAWAHRWVGFATVWLLVAHFALTTTGFALGDGTTVVDEALTLVTTYPFVLLAAAALALFVMVAITSMRAARRRMGYETWFGTHLYVYLAIALGSAHQVVVGSDFADDPVARGYWIALYVITFGLLVAHRVVQPVLTSARHRLRVANVVPEAPGVVSIYLAGRDLDALPIRAGQYVLVRFLTADGWYRAHPFSISAAPNGRFLRITVKDLGDWTSRLQAIPVGTRVFVEGPYGILTGIRRTRRKLLFIGGGVGIAPIRAMLEAFPAEPGDVTVLYRARSWDDVVFRAELDHLARSRGATVHYLVGRRGSPGVPAEPLGAAAIGALVPDAADRDVYLCGPASLMGAARTSLRTLGVPGARIHLESFSY
ncbi:MAG: ferric reductase-like transmembrane domain-containing protein [Chloroflexi bacterium]|jgi:predicted ferric reductase|nr:ferric reductase-like transmembrane domain-containing protein [Chloroflexota bacterium]